jgi:RNA polymerase sigma factor (sigma-70 family)
VLQEILIAVFKNIGKLADGCSTPSPAGWIVGTTVMKIRLYFRKERAREKYEERCSAARMEAERPGPDNPHQHLEEVEVVTKFLTRLPLGERRLLELRMAGVSMDNIREQLGLSEREARRLLYSIREAGKEFFQEHGRRGASRESGEVSDE